jgi:serpin B
VTSSERTSAALDGLSVSRLRAASDDAAMSGRNIRGVQALVRHDLRSSSAGTRERSILRALDQVEVVDRSERAYRMTATRRIRGRAKTIRTLRAVERLFQEDSMRTRLSLLFLHSLLLVACGGAQPMTSEHTPTRHDPRPPTAAEAELFARSTNELGLDMWRELRSTPGDQVFSPASIAVALDMTYAGARGDTATQMAAVLGIDPSLGDALHEAAGNTLSTWNEPSRDTYTLAVANRLFGEQTFRFQQPFIDLTAQTYGAPLEPVDFRGAPDPARVHINDWVAGQTNDRIRDLIPQGAIDEDTRLVLTNAIYFLGRWQHAFNTDATRETAFFVTPERSVQAPTMHQRARLRYAETGDAQVLELPYAGGELAMTIVLPRDRGGLDAIEASLDAERLASWTSALDEREVEVALPKFRVEPADSISLREQLIRLGMTDAFDPGRADLTGMGGSLASDRLFIADVFHKAFVAVDEAGTEAAAATAVIVAVRSAAIRPEPTRFIADHPFLFFIRDLRSGAVLFMGRLADPS